MKKFLSILIISLIACSALAATERLFSFSAGLSSGVPFYGADSVVSTGSEIEKGNRVIIGTLASINVNPIKQVSFYLGNDTLWDITWNKGLSGTGWLKRWSCLHSRLPR